MELQYKEQMAQTAERWEAFWAGEVLDRPLVCVTAPKLRPRENAPMARHRLSPGGGG